jgi:hypothetical protein
MTKEIAAALLASGSAVWRIRTRFTEDGLDVGAVRCRGMLLCEPCKVI